MIEGNVVLEMDIKGVKVQFCDDYCRDKTPEQVDEILKRIAKNALPALRAQHEKESD